MLNENISSVSGSDGAVPKIVYDNAGIKVKFNGNLLKQDKVTHDHGPIVNIYIVHRLIPTTVSTGIALKNCLFGAVKVTNTSNRNSDKWQYRGYGICFDSTGISTHSDDGKSAKNIIVFGADMSNSRHATNKTQSVLVLGHGLIQKINDKTIYAEKAYPLNFTVDNKTFCLSLHYNGDNSYSLVNCKEGINFKAKDSEIAPYPLCLGNLSKDFSVNNMKKARLNGYVYDFSVDYSSITNDKILDIHKYLMEKNNVV